MLSSVVGDVSDSNTCLQRIDACIAGSFSAIFHGETERGNAYNGKMLLMGVYCISTFVLRAAQYDYRPQTPNRHPVVVDLLSLSRLTLRIPITTRTHFPAPAIPLEHPHPHPPTQQNPQTPSSARQPQSSPPAPHFERKLAALPPTTPTPSLAPRTA